MQRSVVLAMVVGLAVWGAEAGAQAPDRAEMVRKAADAGEGVWKRADRDPVDPRLGSRDLFTYALALCEAKRNPERLEKLFALAKAMQDRDPESRSYGNFRWYWSAEKVEDWNAVDFCMQGGSLLWLRHRESLPAAARDVLRELLEFGVEGCLRHRVPESYTNIALMNAVDLVLLGEGLEKPAVAEEGYARLDSVTLEIWENGIHEYGSPTYYGVDLDCLGLLEAFCAREQGKRQARALLELFWTDIAANWYPPAEKLAGTRSRDYDYLRGLGMLHTWVWAAGWLPGVYNPGLGGIFPALCGWRPPERLRELSGNRFPRLVRQVWGDLPCEWRTHYLQRDVTLSASGATYGNMDIPLSVDLPGERTSVRCYFIADARHDPYGKLKIEAGAGHQKTLHLRPFFTAAQRRGDALALVAYREKDIPDTPTLESHFVMPLRNDGLWVGDRKVELREGEPLEVPLAKGAAVVLRKGTAAVGVRLPWARALDGGEAAAALVYDGNKFGAVRVTVDHHRQRGTPAGSGSAAATLWVRVGSGLANDAAFEAWRKQFATAPADAAADAKGVRVRAQGVDGPVAADAAAPYTACPALEPAPTRVLFELDGEDVGRRLLAGIEPVRTFAAQGDGPVILIPEGKGVSWEAESGQVRPRMRVEKDPEASGGAFVWMPGEPGQRGGGSGSVSWRLRVPRAGDYFLWGRVQAPTPDDDSFYVRLLKDGADLIGRADWATGTHARWEWTRGNLGRSGEMKSLALPKGEVVLNCACVKTAPASTASSSRRTQTRSRSRVQGSGFWVQARAVVL